MRWKLKIILPDYACLSCHFRCRVARQLPTLPAGYFYYFSIFRDKDFID